jgi:hypothetical protein
MRHFRLNILSRHNRSRLVMLLASTALLLSSACTLVSPPPAPPPPPPPNQPPVIDSLTAEKEIPTLTETPVVCQASDADGDTLTYQWSADGGTITGEGSTIVWTAPATSDNYTVKVTVSDGQGGTVAQSITIAAIDKPNQPPTISGLTINGSPPGEENRVKQYITTTLQCKAQDPDGDNLNYLWRATRGTITGKGSTVSWTSPGVNGEYTVTVVVSDGRDGKAEGSITFKVLCCGRG